MTRTLIAVLVAAAFGISGGCGPFFQTATVAMVSGRDDHGQLQRRALGLQQTPSDTAVVATVEDGQFVRVTRRDGPWAYVVAANGAGEGWIQDHYLRGEAVRIDPPPPRRVTFVEVERREADVFVRVRFADDGSADWVPASALREVGAR